MNLKKNHVITFMPETEFNTKLSYDNIYIGDIYCCTQYTSSSIEAFKRGVTDFEGYDKKTYETELYKKDAILVRIGDRMFQYYIDLDNYSNLTINKKIAKYPNGSINIIIDNNILESEPSCEGMLYVDKTSLKKVNLIDGKLTYMSFNRNQKIKKNIRKQINEWNNISK